jgi:hypothetical protein
MPDEIYDVSVWDISVPLSTLGEMSCGNSMKRAHVGWHGGFRDDWKCWRGLDVS